MTPLALIQYYASLLILQYLQQPKAYATVSALAGQAIMPQTTVQALSFSGTPASGTFLLNYLPFGINQTLLTTAAINWNDSAATIQTKLQALSGFSSVTVTGSIPAGLVITFTNVQPVVPLLTVTSNSLQTSGAVAVSITVTQTDVVLPLALSAGFNIQASLGAVASGSQLNILGKYVGVTRSGSLSTGVVTLSDSDFLTLILFAALKNSANSDLYTIQKLLNQFFPGTVLVFDYQNMQMSYMISSAIGTYALAQLLVAENLLMRPMGVQLASIIYSSNITSFFSFRTYLQPAVNSSSFNNYITYTLTWPWLSYSNAITT